jgi:hypothetical protein
MGFWRLNFWFLSASLWGFFPRWFFQGNGIVLTRIGATMLFFQIAVSLISCCQLSFRRAAIFGYHFFDRFYMFGSHAVSLDSWRCVDCNGTHTLRHISPPDQWRAHSLVLFAASIGELEAISKVISTRVWGCLFLVILRRKLPSDSRVLIRK